MATEILMRHPNGLTKRAWVGWSWTSLLFGGFPAAFRGDWLGFFVYFIVSAALAILTVGIGNVILFFVWAGIYNRWHARRLIAKGYQIIGAGNGIDAAGAAIY